MTEKKEKETQKKTLSLGSKGGTLSLKSKPAGAPSSSSSKNTLTVEVRGARRKASETTSTPTQKNDGLSEQQKQARLRALQNAQNNNTPGQKASDLPKAQFKKPRKDEPSTETETAQPSKKSARPLDPIAEANIKRMEAEQAAQQTDNKSGRFSSYKKDDDIFEKKRRAEEREKEAQTKPKFGDNRRRGGKITVTQVLNEDYERDRGPSLAAQRRAREKERIKASEPKETVKQVRDVIVPETITVQELSNRMAEKSGDVVKALMKMGVMATVNQTIDADTAELIIDEFGHKVKRVTEADVEIGLEGSEDDSKDLQPRPPVVTIMGHVDHGKTSLLDALREENVVAGEAGGITQHIGAYQVEAGKDKQKITFIDTPGHAAFTEMRARGANITDIVILVVAANDSVMPQTIEAIQHAKAAEVPLIVAVNKIDLPEANPSRVKQDLLQHEVITEDMGGDTMVVEVSAKQRQNLDALLETILLQAEVLELTANPEREAHGTVVEAKMEKGRGSVATVLVNKGTLKQGDIFIVGSEWGKVRILLDDKGKKVNEAEPGKPVEVLGLNGTPNAGDELVVVASEGRAREIVDYRRKKQRDVAAAALGATSIEQLMAKSKDDKDKKILPVMIKADVHGSIEAITGSLQKMTDENEEIEVKVIYTGVGGISESDVHLAKTSNAFIIGFNVRANAQARDLAQQENVTLRYYNIIYNVIDDAKEILTGMLSPKIREELIGYAEIREVFNITKVGKIAGCMITDGVVKKGNKVRLLRDDIVVHEGTLKTLKRFKDEVKEVKEGMECGMAFENYDDIKVGDMIECSDIIEEAQTIN